MLGSNALFARTLCFHLPGVAPWKKTVQGPRMPQGRYVQDIPARSGQAAPTPFQRQIPAQPPQQERRRAVKKAGVPVTLLRNP